MPNDKLETALQAAITILYILKKKRGLDCGSTLLVVM